jgi:hypothetical protein
MTEQYVTADAPTRCAKCAAKMTFDGADWVHADSQEPSECKIADAWESGRRAGQMDPYGLYPTPNPYRSQA